MQNVSSLEKTLILGKIEGRRRRGRQRTRWLDGIPDSVNMSLRSSGRWWRTERPGFLQSMGHKQSDRTKQLNNEVLAMALKQWFWKELQHYQESKEHRSGTQTGLPHSSQSLSSWSQLWPHISCPNFFFYCFQHKLWRLWISTSQIEYDHHIPA